ncbi:hypothetical protein [Pseudooceanicola sp. MF1-13]|uniref:hypothetical protein n=1 Tax=Pseudooceanicola sp. MF1-13 TaxID=3379095 RepID=UPI0038916A90
MTDFSDLARITDAAFQADLAKLRQHARDEARVRQAIADLDRQMEDAMAAQTEVLSPWKALGADQAWRSWIMRKRSEANMQLARVLARKAEAAARVKLSFARNQVGDELAARQKEESRQRRLSKLSQY